MPEIDFNYLGEFKENTDSVFALRYLDDAQETSGQIVRQTKLSVEAAIAAEGLGISIAYDCNEFKTGTMNGLIRLYKSSMEEVLSTLSGLEKKIITPSDLGRYPVFENDLTQICQQTDSTPEEIEQIYNLAPMQQGMLFLSEYGNDSRTSK